MSFSSLCGAPVYSTSPTAIMNRTAQGVVVRLSVWPWIPRRAMCGSCGNRLGVATSRVTPEVELAVETALAGISRATSQWPDGWQVAQHGTEENPHVWFARPDEGPSAARCPCGRVTGEFFQPCSDRDCDLAAGHDGEHYARWPEGHGNAGEQSW